MHMGAILQYNRWVWSNLPFPLGSSRERKKHIKKTHRKNFRGSQGRGPGGSFGARVLYAGVIFPAKYSA